LRLPPRFDFAFVPDASSHVVCSCCVFARCLAMIFF
jgi:hypothetical protein